MKKNEKFEDRYYMIKEVGKGTFGSVMKAFDTSKAMHCLNTKYKRKQEKVKAIK